MCGHQDQRQDQDGHEEHGELAPAVDGVAALHQHSGERSAEDGADGGDDVDGDDEPVGVLEVEAVVAVEELGQIEEVKPPDAVGESLADGKGVGARAAAAGPKSGMLPPYLVWEAKSAWRLAWVWVEPRRRRLYGKSSQTTSQSMPSEPVARKAARHP